MESSKSCEIDTAKLFLPYIVKGDAIDVKTRQLLESTMARLHNTENFSSARHPPQLPHDSFRNMPVNQATLPLSPLRSPVSPERNRQPTEVLEWLVPKDKQVMEPVSYVIGSQPANLEYSLQTSSSAAISKVTAANPGAKPADRSSSKDTSIAGDKRLKEAMELWDLASSYYQSGQLRQARRIYEDVIKEVKAVKGGNINIIIISTRLKIAVITLQQGYFNDAVVELSELERLAKAEPLKHNDKLWDIGRWLAIAMDRQGRYHEAKIKLQQILQVLEAERESDNPGLENKALLLTRVALSLVLAHLGAYRRAIELSENSIKLMETQLQTGGEHKNRERWVQRLARFKANMADILALSGHYKRAKLINEEASKTIEQYMGANCIATLDCWSLEAWLLAALGKIDEAESKCDETLELMRLALGKDHPSTLRTIGILVTVYTSQARLTEARNTAKFLIEENKRILGPSHPQTIYAMSLLAGICIARGGFDEALQLQKQVTEIASKSLGVNHPSTLRYCSNLAMIYCSKSEWIQARVLSRWVFSEQCAVFMRRLKSIETIPSITLMPESIELLPDKVVDDLLKWLKSRMGSMDELEPGILATMLCIGITEREMTSNGLHLALEFHRSAMDFRREMLGKDHPDTLISQLQLAITQRHHNAFQSARENIEEVLRSRVEQLGHDHPDSLSARCELNLVKCHQGKLKEACEDQADILRLRNLLLGSSHPDTINSQRELLAMLENLHLQELAAQIHVSEKSINGYSILSREEKQKIFRTVMQYLKPHVVMRKESLLRPGVSHEHNVRLKPEAFTSIKALVSVYVSQRSFDEAIELQNVLNHHYKLDFDSNTTVEGINKLASIYRVQAAVQRSELARATEEKALLDILSRYCNTQSDLAFLYSSTNDLETAYAIQKEALDMVKSYVTMTNPSLMDLESLATAELAGIVKAMGRTNEALSLLNDARKCSRMAGSSPSQKAFYDEMTIALEVWGKEPV